MSGTGECPQCLSQDPQMREYLEPGGSGQSVTRVCDEDWHGEAATATETAREIMRCAHAEALRIVSARSAAAAGPGLRPGWIDRERSRAAARFEALPPYYRPVIVRPAPPAKRDDWL